MTTCLSIPRTLADAEAIAVCAGGSDWRTPFLYGLGAVGVAGLCIVALVLFAYRRGWI